MDKPDTMLLLFATLLMAQHTEALGLEDHECSRPCSWPPQPKTCRYTFTVEWLNSMSSACYDCPFYLTDCERPGCIPLSGVPRPIVVVNRQLPGPHIQVCEDDDVEVKVWNRLGNSEGTSVHWHALHQRGTPYMDGSAMITQCPISPQASFTYKFKASPGGTQWWHSHSNLQRKDGMFGAFIVKQAPQRDVHSNLYDYDLPEHVVSIMDLTHGPSIASFAGQIDPFAISSVLINGKGASQEYSNDDKTVFTPREVFKVKKGNRYRFRVIGNVLCHWVIAIQAHSMKIISTDAFTVNDVEVNRIGLGAGERYDFVLTADQEIDNYWIRIFTEDFACMGVPDEFAILRYDDAPVENPPEPFSEITSDGIFLNPAPVIEGRSEDQLRTVDLLSTVPIDEKLLQEPDLRVYMSLALSFRTKWNMYDPYDYPNPKVSDCVRQTRGINHMSFKIPPSPPLSQLSDIPETEFCDAEDVFEDMLAGGSKCSEEFCSCTQKIKIELGQVVELVLIGVEDAFGIDHPMHIHGYSFRVIGSGKLPRGTTVQDIIRMDQQGNLTRSIENAVIKDSVIVPGAGYTIIRFIADNPGWWLFHCHFNFHLADGMSVVLQVGEPSDLPPVPENFPRCGSWSPTADTGDGGDKGRKNEGDSGYQGPERSEKLRKQSGTA